jgi:hypothetical protein
MPGPVGLDSALPAGGDREGAVVELVVMSLAEGLLSRRDPWTSAEPGPDSAAPCDMTRMVWRVCGRRMRAASAIIVAPRVRPGRYHAENSGFGVAHLARADRHGGAKCLRDIQAEGRRRGDAALHSGNDDAHIYADRAAQGKVVEPVAVTHAFSMDAADDCSCNRHWEPRQQRDAFAAKLAFRFP